MKTQNYILAVAGVMLLAVCVRGYRLGAQSLWVDEAFSLRVATQPWNTLLLPGGYRDIHPPLYFAGLKTVLPFTSPERPGYETAVRVPSALFAVLAVAVVIWVGTTLFGRAGGLLAGLLLAVSAYPTWHGQEARMYSLGILLATLQLALTVQIMERKALPPAWIALWLATVAGGLTHWYMVFIWPVLAGYALWRRPDRQTVVRWTLLYLGAAAVLLIYLWPKIASGRGAEDSGVTDLKSLAYGVWSLWTGYCAGPNTLDLRGARLGDVLREFLPVMLPCAAAAIVVLTLVLRATGRMQRNAAALLWTCVAVGVLAPFVLSLLTGKVYRPRYSFLVLPALALLLAGGTLALAARWQKIALCTAFAGAQIFCLANWYWNPYYGREDFRAAAAYLRQAPTPGVEVLLTNDAASVLEAYGLRSDRWRTYDYWDPLAADLPLYLAKQVGTRGEVWHLAGDRWRVREHELRTLLDERYRGEPRARWHGVQVVAYRPRA